jgi:hypothetical protein
VVPAVVPGEKKPVKDFWKLKKGHTSADSPGGGHGRNRQADKRKANVSKAESNFQQVPDKKEKFSGYGLVLPFDDSGTASYGPYRQRFEGARRPVIFTAHKPKSNHFYEKFQKNGIYAAPAGLCPFGLYPRSSGSGRYSGAPSGEGNTASVRWK